MGENPRTILLAQIQRAIHDCSPDEIFFVKRTPWPRTETVFESQSWLRWTLILSGHVDMRMIFANELQTIRLSPRQAVFMVPFCSEKVIFRNGESLALVLRPNYLRLVYSCFCKEQPPENIVYHLDSVSQATVYALKALNALAESTPPSIAAVDLARLILCLAHSDLSHATENTLIRSNELWRQMAEYAEDNCLNRISRKDLAARFKITPEYVSRLFALNGSKEGFSEFINRHRIDCAARMLKETDDTVDLIAWQCGFSHTSYFIRLFRRYHGLSPAQFRLL